MFKRTVAIVCSLSLILSLGIFQNVTAADTRAPYISIASPKNNQTGVAINKVISIKFNENIYKSLTFTNIKIINAKGKRIGIKATILNNYLKIKHTYLFAYNTYYYLTLPAKMVKDRAGNKFAKTVTIKFKTRARSIPIVPTPTPKLTYEQIAQKTAGVVYIVVYNRDLEAIFSGSGFVINNKIITNCHVIERAFSASFQTSDEKLHYITGVYSFDDEKDIAVLKTNATGLTNLTLGNSDILFQGQEVVAIGSPLGLQNTISNGLVSAIRDNEIQISVPISFGSSGGPLFNMYGDVVGITSSGYDMIGNLNFAIPINEVKSMLNTTTDISLPEMRRQINPSYSEEAEPNDETHMAKTLNLDRTAAAYINSIDDYDYHKINIVNAGNYSFNSTIGSDGLYCDNYFVSLRDSENRIITTASVYYNKDSEVYTNEIKSVYLDAGIYYVLINPNTDDFYDSMINREYYLDYKRI